MDWTLSVFGPCAYPVIECLFFDTRDSLAKQASFLLQRHIWLGVRRTSCEPEYIQDFFWIQLCCCGVPLKKVRAFYLYEIPTFSVGFLLNASFLPYIGCFSPLWASDCFRTSGCASEADLPLFRMQICHSYSDFHLYGLQTFSVSSSERFLPVLA